MQKPYDTDRLLAVVQAELSSVLAANLFGPFVSQPQNGKNGAGHGRQPTEKESNLMTWADDGGPTA
ncbi:MAG: hypothetical protein BroJett015_11900 [Chloroflexota bacterium]|nr:hypothetical protein [Ardenticatenaceae bacterium]GIK55527.1 MAG: hypothetical protein BroJett015_11900 [Chloroflexota bacterium]